MKDNTQAGTLRRPDGQDSVRGKSPIRMPLTLSHKFYFDGKIQIVVICSYETNNMWKIAHHYDHKENYYFSQRPLWHKCLIVSMDYVIIHHHKTSFEDKVTPEVIALVFDL